MTLILLLSACGQTDEQRQFERDALSAPDGYTETNSTGEILENDPDDWRVAPFFQGLVEVNPAYPNPVQTTDRVNIEFTVTGIESVMGLEVAVYYQQGTLRTIYQEPSSPLQPGITLIQFQAAELGRFDSSESTIGLHRVVLFDNNGNIISYGDIMVE